MYDCPCVTSFTVVIIACNENHIYGKTPWVMNIKCDTTKVTKKSDEVVSIMSAKDQKVVTFFFLMVGKYYQWVIVCL